MTVMPAATARRRHPDRSFLVDIVDMQNTTFEDCGVDRGVAEQQPRIAMPQHRPFACRLIDEDDGELVVSLADDDVGEVDVAGGEILAHPTAVRVIADRAEKASAEAERRARGEHRRDLAAAGDEVRVDAQLGFRRGPSRGAGEKVDVVDGAGAEADNVHQA